MVQKARPDVLGVALVLFLALSSPASAQIQVHAGTMLEFFHGVEQFALTQKYQLCVDAVSTAACPDIALVQPSTVVGWYQFPLPTTVAPGLHYIGVRAVGFGTVGPTAVSNALQVNVNAPPGTWAPPTSFRLVP